MGLSNIPNSVPPNQARKVETVSHACRFHSMRKAGQEGVKEVEQQRGYWMRSSVDIKGT